MQTIVFYRCWVKQRCDPCLERPYYLASAYSKRLARGTRFRSGLSYCKLIGSIESIAIRALRWAPPGRVIESIYIYMYVGITFNFLHSMPDGKLWMHAKYSHRNQNDLLTLVRNHVSDQKCLF